MLSASLNKTFPSFLSDLLSVQPDLTQTVVTVQHASDAPNNNHVLNGGADKSPPIYSVPDTTGSPHRLSATPGNTLLIESSLGQNGVGDGGGGRGSKDSLSTPSRPASQPDNLQDSRQSMISMQLPSTIDAEAVTWSTFSSSGGRLILPESGACRATRIGYRHWNRVCVVRLV